MKNLLIVIILVLASCKEDEETFSTILFRVQCAYGCYVEHTGKSGVSEVIPGTQYIYIMDEVASGERVSLKAKDKPEYYAGTQKTVSIYLNGVLWITDENSLQEISISKLVP